MSLQIDIIEKEIQFPFFSGGGELGELTRNFHWSTSPIGSPQLWPTALKTMVRLVLQSPQPMLLWWGDELIQFYNDPFRIFFGVQGRHPYALGQRAQACWPEAWQQMCPLIEAARSGHAVAREDQLVPIFRNGRIEDAYFTFTYTPVHSEHGKVEGVLAVCNETTEKMHVLRKLQEHREEMDFAIDAAGLGTFDLDPFTQRFVANTRVKEWFGLTPREDIRLDLAIAAVATHDRQRVLETIYYAMTYESGGDYDIEYSIIHPVTGHSRRVHARGKVIFDSQKVATRFSGVVQDISNVKKSADRLQQTAARLELALDAGKLGSYEWVVGTGEIICNEQCKKMFGIDGQDEFLFDQFVNIIAPQDREHVIKSIERAFAGHRLYNAEYRAQMPDGSIAWLRASGKGIYDEQDRPVRMIGIVSDITEEKHSAAVLEKMISDRTIELKRKNKELERSNASLEEFTHIASHDLKEPMRKIGFFTDRLKNQLQGRLTEEEIASFGRIENANGKMITLIDDLLTYSRLNQRGQEMEPVDLNERVQKVLEDFEVDIQQKRATITVSQLPMVKGYPLHLLQLFQNLISNALKYQQPGVPPVIAIGHRTMTIEPGEETSLPAGTSFHVIDVRDNGIGFEQVHAERIFQMFQRLHGNAEYRGTGVGLAIARKVMELHHGTITALGEPGNGAVFSIYFPIMEA